MARTYSTQAIVLKRLNLGEADRLVTVFSKPHGKLKLIAKGIRRPSSRKKGHLEPFTHAKIHCAKTKSLDIITEAETISNFSQLRKNLSAVRLAYLFCELVDQLTAENQEHSQVFQLLLSHLNHLNQTHVSKNIIIDFETQLLRLLGFGLPQTISRQSLETHIASITEKPLNSKKIRYS